MQGLKAQFDPKGIMNKGTIFPEPGAIQPAAADPDTQFSAPRA
ncbi:hypothetical protein P9139_06745 [Curtobacterium flaccumfaciens]|nr:hypothetical protein P9139_06745 [Curtobacterium flaccumfaciens]